MLPSSVGQPLPRNTILRRYIGLQGLIAMLETQRLRFTRVDAFRDPFEGSVPKQQMDDQLLLLPRLNVPNDSWNAMTLRRRAMTRSAHACCWAAGDESEAMWRLYCDDDEPGQGPRACSKPTGRGVAVECTLEAIDAFGSEHGLIVRPIEYRYYHVGPAFTTNLDSFFHKRLGFRHESEVRLLSFNEHEANTRANVSRGQPHDGLDSPLYLHFGGAIRAMVDRLVVSPYADRVYEERVRDEVAAVDRGLANKVQLSVLSERQYAPSF